jgi:hypothetical protein
MSTAPGRRTARAAAAQNPLYGHANRNSLVAVRNGRIRERVRRETIADRLARDRARTQPPPTRHGRADSGCEALLYGE